MRPLLTASLAYALLVSPVSALQAPAQSPASFRLGKVEVVGTKRYSPAEVLKVGGLTLGQQVAVADLDGAARRLASTGLFTNVRYRYVTTAAEMVLTFDMVEEAWTMPVVFDNFVWFTDEELTTILRQSIPQFNRIVPSNAGSSAFIARELQSILEARRLPGRVDFTMFTDVTSDTNRHFIFTIIGAGEALRLCAVRFIGAKGIPDSVLQETASELKNRDYSRSFTAAWSNGTLRQLYRRRGFWKASFGDPIATPQKDGGCNGVTVAVQVAEGAAYAWDRAEWTGNSALTTRDLDAALAMKAGDVSDLSKIEAGLRSVEAAYQKRGYLRQAVTFTPRLDDAARRVTMEMTVTEGVQFVMGALEIVGLPTADADSLRKKWRLKPGDVYDASYLTEFVRVAAAPIAQSGPRNTIASSIRTDAATRQVTVRVEFK